MSYLVSRHFFRRTARRRAHRLNADARMGRVLRGHYDVQPAPRGPYRWEIRRLTP